MGEEKITVNETCIVRRSPGSVEIQPHPDAREWHARFESEVKDGLIHMPTLILPATAARTSSDED